MFTSSDYFIPNNNGKSMKTCLTLIGKSDSDKGSAAEDSGLIIGNDTQAGKVATGFIKAIAQHRNWSRKTEDQVPELLDSNRESSSNLLNDSRIKPPQIR